MNSPTSSSSLKTGATTLRSSGVRSGVSDIVVAFGAGSCPALTGRSSYSGLSRASIYRSSCLRMTPEHDRPPPARASLAGRVALLRAPVLVQFIKFGIVGVSNTLLTFLVYTLLLKVFGVWYLAASAIGFGVGATNGFLLNRRWTFR